MKTHLLLSTFLVILSGFAPGNAAARELKVRALAFKPGFPVEVHAHAPGESATAGVVRLKSYLNHEANVLNIKGTRLVFTRSPDPASATSETDRLAEIEIPLTTPSVILLFLPDSAEKEIRTCRVVTIDDGPKAFPPGSYKVANFASVPVKIEVGEQSHEFAAGETKVIEKLTYGANQAVGTRAFSKRGDKWQMISSGSWSDPGARRVLQIFSENQPSGKVEVKGIRDIAAP